MNFVNEQFNNKTIHERQVYIQTIDHQLLTITNPAIKQLNQSATQPTPAPAIYPQSNHQYVLIQPISELNLVVF